MTTAAAPGRERVAGRFTAGLAMTSALVHVLDLDASSLGASAMAAMAVACLPCAWHLWRSPTCGVWGVAATVDVAMLVLHARMLVVSDAGHHHAGPAVPTALMWFGVLLVAAQLLVTGSVAIRSRRYRTT